jgi:hypothetical protein
MVETPEPYRVTYTEHVRRELRNLIARAKKRGLGDQVIAAVRQIDERLRVYPQFGQPLRDLELKPAQLWIGVVPPLVVHYLLDEESRLVIVGAPITPITNSGIDPEANK